MNWKTKILPAFSFDRIVRRLVASWFGMAFILLLFEKGDFSDVAFLKDKDWGLPICLFLGFFVLISALSVFLPTKRTDGFAMLLGLVTVSSAWLSRLKMEVNEKWLFCFVLVAVYAMVLWDFVTQNRDLFEKLHLPSSVALGIMITCGVVCAAVIAVTTCLRYINFSCPTYDFGIFAQMFHNMAETFEPLTTCERDEVLSHFAVHLSPIYYLLLPFYWLFPSPLTLQIGQAVIIASGIVPFYLLMRKWDFSPRSRILFSFVYMLYPVISKGCFFDLHENAFLLPLLLWLFWAYESEKIPFLALFTVLCCLVKEDSAVYVTIFALYCILSGKSIKRKLMGAGIAVYAVLYFLFAVWYINTFGLGIMSGRFENVSSDGSLVGVIFTAFANPGFFFQEVLTMGWDSLRYVLALLVPLGFLPLASGKPTRWFLLIPMLLNLLTDYPYQLDLIFQYHFGIAAFLLYLALQNWRDLRGKARQYLAALTLAAGFVFYSYLIIPELCYRVQIYRDNREQFAVLEDTLETIPEDASVNASTFLVPHLANRFYLYDVDYHPEADTDLVILDIRSGYSGNTQTMAETCKRNGYTCLLETTQIAVFVNPDWEGDSVALKEDIRAVATVVSESRTFEERLEDIKEILAILPEDATYNTSKTLVSLIKADTVYNIVDHTPADTDFVVMDMRFGETYDIANIATECLFYGFGKLIENDEIAIYASPLWLGDYDALRDQLVEMGYLEPYPTP